MAFFDVLSKKVSEAGQKTKQITRDLSDTTRYNSMIADEEKRIRTVYAQIGELYVSMHREDSEEPFAELVGTVTEAETKIREYNELLKKLKGIRRCEVCGGEVPKDASFCSSCGSKMPVLPASGNVFCKNCGSEVDGGMRFCTSCGHALAGCQGLEAPSVLCPSCGTKVESGMRFCTTCGTSLDDPQVTVSRAVEEALEESAPQMVCPNCGAGVGADLLFCIECGTKL